MFKVALGIIVCSVFFNIHQGCALAAPGCHRRLTFGLGQLEKQFFTHISLNPGCPTSKFGLLVIFLIAQLCSFNYYGQIKILITLCISLSRFRWFSLTIITIITVLSPTARSSPPNRKSVRTNSPETKRNEKVMEASNVKSKKSLQFDDRGKTDDFFRAVHCNVLSKCNIDDLDTSKGAAVKVVISYPSGEVSVINKIDEEGQSIIRKITLKNWATVANACLRHELLAPEFKDAFAREVAKECKDYTKSESCLKESSPISYLFSRTKQFLKKSRSIVHFVQCALSGINHV